MNEYLIALLAGIVQGIVEWLPVSSQGNLALVLSALSVEPTAALQLALFFQVGTTLSATTYYRADLAEAARSLSGWRPADAFGSEHATTSYLLVACAMTGLVGLPLYVFAIHLAGQVTGGAFVALVGVLLILTGFAQRRSRTRADSPSARAGSPSARAGSPSARADTSSASVREEPTLVDSILVGVAQGLAILPGVSRSGVTTSTLLFRRYDPPAAFRLSFLLSIPATLGAATLTLVDAGGVPAIAPAPAALALAVSAVVGYLTIDALVRTVERVPFALVCYGLGGLAIVGGGVVSVLAG